MRCSGISRTPPTPALGLDQPSRIYRARKGGEPVALVFEAAAADGYSGHIGLILAVRKTGEVVAVRVTEHRKTPGLGDYIDPRKDKNREHPWITQFSRLSLDNFRWRSGASGRTAATSTSTAARPSAPAP